MRRQKKHEKSPSRQIGKFPFEPRHKIPTMWYVRPAKPQISLRTGRS